MTNGSNREIIRKVAFSLLVFSSMALGQDPISCITRKPINTAAVTGSSNITLECACNLGTDFIFWSFTPLGNHTTVIANGYQLYTTYQQLYVLHATVNSSVLIIRQLSNLTEGTYRCYTVYTDIGGSASAVLLAIPFPISMDQLFGPIAGGTNITIIGSATIDYMLRYFRSYIPYIMGVRNVYIGYDLSATSVSVLHNDSSTFDVVAVTPSTTEESIGQHLPVIIEFSPNPFNMTFNRAFTYMHNPEITGIYPNSFIVTGGTLLEVTGKSLSSVAKPIIQLMVFISRAVDNSSTSNTSTTSTSRVCTVLPGDDTYMQCPMPPLSLPYDFLEILNLEYNTSGSRKRRHTRVKNRSLLLRLKREINSVQTVRGPNGIDQADIYLGFIFDGYNYAPRDKEFFFYSGPEITSSNQLLEFDPSEDEFIYVKGRYMLRGCRLRDYLVYIGNQICNNSDLQDNQLSCRPPKEKPSSLVNDTIYCDQYLSITITLGYKQYQYACLTYRDRAATKRVDLIVGLTVGLGGFAIFLSILIVCIVICRRKKVSRETERHQNTAGLEARNNAAQPELQQVDNGRQRQPYDDYLQPNIVMQRNDEYLTSAA